MANAARVSLLTAALRSDRFQQGTGYLTLEPGQPTEQNCCLGVACTVAMENGLHLDYVDGDTRLFLDDEGHTCGTEGDNLNICACYSNDTVLPHAVVQWYGFDADDPDMDVTVDDSAGPYEARLSAATLNDDKAYNFAQIADAFDTNFVHLAEPEDPEGLLEP